MHFQDDQVVQDLYLELDQLNINPEKQYIWQGGLQGRADNKDDWDKQQETNLLIQNDNGNRKLQIRPNPEFQVTIYRQNSEIDSALQDQQQESVIHSIHRFDQNCFAYRYFKQNQVSIEFVSEEDAKMGLIPNQNAEVLFHLKVEQSLLEKGKKFFTLKPQQITVQEDKKYKYKKLEKRIYKNIKSKQYLKYNNNDTRHRLRQGDQIRFGLQMFKVSEIQPKDSSIRLNEKFYQGQKIRKEEKNQIHTLQKLEEGTCKICLSTQNQIGDPLLDPCECKGSCQHVHLSCLKTWLDSNLQKQSDPLIDSYKWTKFQCQICKTQYPLQIKYQSQLIKLAGFTIPHQPHIVFERIRSGCRKKIMVVKGQQLPIHVGRTNESDFKIPMSFISRRHAVIEFKNGSFYLSDCDSKYGTLVRINQPTRVEGKMKVQVGDVMMRFDLVMKKNGIEYVWKFD